MSSDPDKPKDFHDTKTPLNIKSSHEDDAFWDLDDDTFIAEDQSASKLSNAELVSPAPVLLEESKSHESIQESCSLSTSTNETSESAGFYIKHYLTSLSGTERFFIVSIIVIVSLAGIFLCKDFSDNLPTHSLIAEDLNLPIKGKSYTITSVETYWREPITTGENTDIVRHNTAIIPCIRLSIEGDGGAIRVLFYDDNKNLIGDSVSREIKGKESVEISSTAGFDNIGMHTAYVANRENSWTIEILEGPSLEAPISEFNSLLKTHISSKLK